MALGSAVGGLVRRRRGPVDRRDRGPAVRGRRGPPTIEVTGIAVGPSPRAER